jgi:hypothetical protein
MKKWILFSVLLLLIIGGAVAFYVLSQPPQETLSKDFKEKAVTKILGRKAELDEVPQKQGNVSYNGKFIQFEYPAKAIIYNLKDPGFASSSSLLEDFSFDIKDPRLVLNLAVLQAGKITNISDNPGVKLRQSQPGTYSGQNITIDGHSGLVYEGQGDTPEKTAFFLVNGRIYTIAVTGTNFDDVKNLADGIFKIIKFKN